MVMPASVETLAAGRPFAADRRWRVRDVRMKFGFGSLLLWSARFRAVQYEGAWDALPPDPDEPLPALGDCPPVVRGILVNSHPVEGRISRIALRRSYIRYSASQCRRFFIGLDGSFDEYMLRFSPKRRSELRRKLRVFAERSGGDIHWREYRDPEEMPEFHRLAREVSAKSYQERMSDAGMPSGDTFVGQLRHMAADGVVRGHVLFLAGRPVAYQYCVAHGTMIEGVRKGYDPAFRHLSPGTVLLLLSIRRLFRMGEFRVLDMNRGEFEYKQTFATAHAWCADIYYFRWTFRNVLLILGHTALDLLHATVAGFPGVGRWKKKLRNLVRYGHHS
ncbi:MAG: GNAT family N-acetyltransferase [Bryobacteraceae bacterium]|jgi:CelD/BcsL family acetyltransferase involved in cellulose biosynthesis